MCASPRLNIGFAQFAPALGDREATLTRIEQLAPLWAGADLVVLPELCNSGYNFADRAAAEPWAEDPHHSEFVEMLTGLCQNQRQHIVTGFCERDGDHLFNTALLIGAGGVQGRYRKLHLFMNEKDIFTPGNLGLPVFDLGSIKLGMLICFDWLFPEAWRVLALRGADVIAHPSNLVLPGHCQRAMPTYALINGFFVITANRIGTEGDLTFTGGSLIAGPTSEVLASADAESDLVRVVEVDIARARDKYITPRNHVLRDRRPEEYRLLVRDVE